MIRLISFAILILWGMAYIGPWLGYQAAIIGAFAIWFVLVTIERLLFDDC